MNGDPIFCGVVVDAVDPIVTQPLLDEVASLLGGSNELVNLISGKVRAVSFVIRIGDCCRSATTSIWCFTIYPRANRRCEVLWKAS